MIKFVKGKQKDTVDREDDEVCCYGELVGLSGEDAAWSSQEPPVDSDSHDIASMYRQMRHKPTRSFFPLSGRCPRGVALLRGAGWDGESGGQPVSTRWGRGSSVRSGLGSKRERSSVETRVTHFPSAYTHQQVLDVAQQQDQVDKPQKESRKRAKKKSRKRAADFRKRKEKQLYQEIVQDWRD